MLCSGWVLDTSDSFSWKNVCFRVGFCSPQMNVWVLYVIIDRRLHTRNVDSCLEAPSLSLQKIKAKNSHTTTCHSITRSSENLNYITFLAEIFFFFTLIFKIMKQNRRSIPLFHSSKVSSPFLFPTHVTLKNTQQTPPPVSCTTQNPLPHQSTFTSPSLISTPLTATLFSI